MNSTIKNGIEIKHLKCDKLYIPISNDPGFGVLSGYFGQETLLLRKLDTYTLQTLLNVADLTVCAATDGGHLVQV